MASHIGRDEVERIAKLAHLTIAPDDAPRFAEQLSAILEYAASIQRVDTIGVPRSPARRRSRGVRTRRHIAVA